MVLLLLTFCLLLLPLWESVIVLCFVVLYVHSSIAIILMGKRELVALLNLSSWCLVTVKRLFLAVPRGCLQFVIVVFPDHTHLLFLQYSWETFKAFYNSSALSLNITVSSAYSNNDSLQIINISSSLYSHLMLCTLCILNNVQDHLGKLQTEMGERLSP